jgi:hypothetical protein
MTAISQTKFRGLLLKQRSITQSSKGGRLVKWKGRTASIAPSLLSVSLVALSTGMALAETVISTGLTVPQTITVDENVTVSSTGSVTVDARDAAIIEIDVSDYSSDVLIDGNLSNRSDSAEWRDSAIGVKFTGEVSGTVTNNADISVDVKGENTFYAYGMSMGDVSGAVSNDGIIEVVATAKGVNESASASASGVYTNSYLGSFSNDGTIEVTATASGSVGSNSLYARASAVYLRDTGGVIINDANLTATAIADGTAGFQFAEASGIYASFYNGALSNNGIIEVVATAKGFGGSALASVWGVYAGSLGLNGSVINKGSILVSLTETGMEATGLYGTAWGIQVGEIGANASLSNDGSIEVATKVEGNTAKDSAGRNGTIFSSVYGIDIWGANSGTVSNNGSISVTTTMDATADASVGFWAWGMDLKDVSGVVSNDGNILVTASVDGTASEDIEASAFGIDLKNLSGTVSNDGNISATASVDGTAGGNIAVFAHGMQTDQIGVSGVLSNKGSISVTASASGAATTNVSATAYGMYMRDVSGVVSNDGSISVTAKEGGISGSSIEANAYGIYARYGAISGTVSNDGSIVVTATAEGSAIDDILADARGMYLNDVSGTVSNDGSISVTAKAGGVSGSSIEANAYGIYIYAAGAISGTVSNDGSIVVTATAEGSARFAWATAVGLSGSIYESGTLTNTGSIIVSAEANNLSAGGSVSEIAKGIDIDVLDGTLINSGRVLAFAANGGDAATAIYVGAGTGSATFTTESFFAGRLSLGNAELTVESVANTPSIFWTFADIPNTVTLDGANGPKLYSKVTDDGTIIATVQPTNLAFAGHIAADMANMGGGTVAAMLAATPDNMTTDPDKLYPLELSMASGQSQAFVERSLMSRKVDDAAGRQMGLDVAGATAGFVNRLESGLGYGVTISRVASKGSTPSGLGADTVDSSGTVIGAYGNTALGTASLTFGVTVGSLAHSGTRSVNDNLAASGVSTVSSEYGSTFVSPSIEASWTVPAGDMTMRPHVGYRYTTLNVDGFTETGGLAAATFGARVAAASDFKIGAELSRSVSNGTLTGSADILRRVVSDNGASVALFDDTGRTATANTNFTALELGIGYTMPVEAGEVSIGATGVLSNNGASSYGVTAGYRISF